MAISPPQPTQAIKPHLVVVKALYGYEDTRVEVTDHLNKAIRDGRLRLHVGNQIAGDPCPGFQKNVVVTYRYGDQEPTQTFAEGTDLDLP